MHYIDIAFVFRSFDVSLGLTENLASDISGVSRRLSETVVENHGSILY